jgi:hypothetical protein
VLGILVVLGDSPPDIDRRGANNSVLIRVVGRLPPKNINPDGSLFEVFAAAVEGLVDDVFKERPATLALVEKRTGEKPIELRDDGSLVGRNCKRSQWMGTDSALGDFRN